MKKLILFAVMVAFCNFSFAQNYKANKEALKKEAATKVAYMQSIIKFNGTKAHKLKKIEYVFLLNVEKVTKNTKVNSSKEIEKLKMIKNKAIVKILARDEYLKYTSIENKRIKKHPLWVR